MSSFTTTADQPNKAKKHLPCLGCGESMWTDRGHRFCRKCQRRNDAAAMKSSYRVIAPREVWLMMETPATRAWVE